MTHGFRAFNFNFHFILLSTFLLSQTLLLEPASAAAIPHAQSPSVASESHTTFPTTVALTASTSPWTLAALPNPVSQPRLCNRPTEGFLCDPDHLLPDPDEADVVAGILMMIHNAQPPYDKPPQCIQSVQEQQAQAQAQTQPQPQPQPQAGKKNNPPPPQLAVLIVERVKPYSNSATEASMKDIERFANDVHDLWGVGDSLCQNGVVMVVAMKDRKLWISTGKGVKDILNDHLIQIIIAKMKQYLKAGTPTKALEIGAHAIGMILSGDASAAATLVDDNDHDDDDDVINSLLIPMGIIAAFFGFSYWGKRKEQAQRREYAQVASRLSQLERDRAEALANRYQVKSCPICFEEWDLPPEIASTTTSSTASATLTNASSDPNNTEAQNLAPNSITNTNHAPSSSIRPSTTSRPTQILRCGHKFCQECLTQWIMESGNRNCPVCRQSINPHPGRPDGGPGAPPDDNQHYPGHGPPPSYSGTSCSSNYNNNYNQYYDWGFYEPELRFRARRLRHLYPSYVTASMLQSWERDNYHGSLSRNTVFMGLDPSLRTQAARMGTGGSSGTSYSFGGGSSSGGGGGGGSW